MKTVYIAPHRTYVLDADGCLLALADKAPTELPQTLSARPWLPKLPPGGQQLIGPWLTFLQAIGRAMVAAGARQPLWPGETLRLRRWLPGPRCTVNPEHEFCMRFDREVTL